MPVAPEASDLPGRPVPHHAPAARPLRHVSNRLSPAEGSDEVAGAPRTAGTSRMTREWLPDDICVSPPAVSNRLDSGDPARLYGPPHMAAAGAVKREFPVWQSRPTPGPLLSRLAIQRINPRSTRRACRTRSTPHLLPRLAERPSAVAGSAAIRRRPRPRYRPAAMLLSLAAGGAEAGPLRRHRSMVRHLLDAPTGSCRPGAGHGPGRVAREGGESRSPGDCCLPRRAGEAIGRRGPPAAGCVIERREIGGGAGDAPAVIPGGLAAAADGPDPLARCVVSARSRELAGRP